VEQLKKQERVVAIVEARMGSTRLPGKSMRALAGAPLAQRVAERVRRARTIDEVVIATSVSPKDDVLADHMKKAGFAVHRGSELDVLGRILGAAQAHSAAIHVQCWGDCPFLEPSEVDRVVDALRTTGADLLGNGLGPDRQLPLGLDVIALRVAALEAAERATRDNAYHREHGTTYIYQTPGAFRTDRVATPEDLRFPKVNLTINEQSDFDLVASIYDALQPQNPTFGIRDVFALVRARPEMLAHPNFSALAT
jgi:spore coat polysaccharide biosynthesis protein SpsF (cytidylyltransferase family)